MLHKYRPYAVKLPLFPKLSQLLMHEHEARFLMLIFISSILDLAELSICKC